MPFPTTVYVSRTIRSPVLEGGTLVEHVAGRLRAAGLAGVSADGSVVRYDPTARQAGATDFGQGPGLLGPVEIELIDRGNEVELVAESYIGRVPLAFGTGTLVAATMAGGAHAISLAGGLIGGALVAIVPWFVARIRLAALLKRIEGAGEREGTNTLPTNPR